MSPKNLSLVVPTLNEAASLPQLLVRINDTFVRNNIDYEVIIVDDNSTDSTASVVKELATCFPVRFYTKQGKKGKAQSLLEGFSYAKYDLLGMIDGDLQYPPEKLPEMIEKISEGFDIVVANRRTRKTAMSRELFSKSFRFVFVKLLHKIDCDSQSGLKVFKKEIIQRITIDPSPWTFDLEFLLTALHAGYTVTTIDINFDERTFGDSKVDLFKTSYQIGSSALKLKLSDIDPIPLLPEAGKEDDFGFHHKGQKFVLHSALPINQTAFFRLDRGQSSLLVLISVVLIFAAFLNWFVTLIIILSFLSFLYLLDLFFNLFLISRSFSQHPEVKIDKSELELLKDEDLPVYTIFCPLYKEWQVLPQFTNAINNLNYPKNKLEVLLLLEEKDSETITQARSMDLPSFFKIIVVPDSNPKTKPKACNYGLKFTTGEYSVIYDAEDIPDPDQLKKTLIAFRKLPENIACIQAKLNFYNPNQNLLTKIFTAEYSLWFDLILTGLQSINAPIPLGGTSNHFKTQILRDLKGWDPFNVTEDCDLGIRLFKKGLRTAIVDSTTHEEANSDLMNWLGQRSRWIKGYIQSYFVHMRNPKELAKDWKDPHIISFQLIVGGKILSMLVNPFMWLTTILYFAFRPTLGPLIESIFPPIIFYPAVFAAVVGNFLYFYYYMIGCAKRGYFSLEKFAYLVPFYWLFMSVAAWIAVVKIITQPHYWYKTKHGLHLGKENGHDSLKNAHDLVDAPKPYEFA